MEGAGTWTRCSFGMGAMAALICVFDGDPGWKGDQCRWSVLWVQKLRKAWRCIGRASV